ncbi:hypothetical protein VPH35_057702 [Triticum aestivum]
MSGAIDGEDESPSCQAPGWNKRLFVVLYFENSSQIICACIVRGRMLMRANLVVERHASKICTRATFEQFGHILNECGAYQVEEVDKHRTYIAIHSEAEKREKWCRASYKVTMLDEGNEFEFECGQFAHVGLLCRHVLKVLDFIRAKEIPVKHIVKRWMKDARDILPAHLTQYQKDKVRDGLGLHDRLADKGAMLNRVQPMVDELAYLKKQLAYEVISMKGEKDELPIFMMHEVLF